LDLKKTFANLVSMQSLLFALADDRRRENQYCQPVHTTDFDKVDSESHYAAISRFSYHKHKTIEVRIHESTTNLDVVEKWMRLLKTIGDYRGPDLKLGTANSEYNQLVDQIKPAPDIIEYVSKKNIQKSLAIKNLNDATNELLGIAAQHATYNSNRFSVNSQYGAYVASSGAAPLTHEMIQSALNSINRGPRR
jgi:hypothetical protein